MRLPRICRRCASAFVRNCEGFGQRLSPSWRVDWSRRADHAVGRVGRPCRGRCKYVPVSSVAASMRLTPLHGLPTLPSTVSRGRPPRKKERRATAGRALRLLGAEHGSALQGALQNQGKRTRRKPRPFSFPSVRQYTNALAHRHRETVEGGTGAAGRTVGALDGAIEPPWTGLRRVLPAAPVPPSHQQPRAALAFSRLAVGSTRLWLLPAAGGPPRVSAALPHPGRSGSSRRCRQCRSSRSGSSPGTAGDNPRRSSTPAPDTRSRW